MNDVIKYSLIAMILVSFAPSLARWIMLKEGLSSKEILTISTFVVFVLFFSENLLQGGNPLQLFCFSKSFFLSAVLGLIFGGSLYFYYTALSIGTVSQVVTIWGLQIVGASLVALIVFREGITIHRSLGVFFALLSIFFSTR